MCPLLVVFWWVLEMVLYHVGLMPSTIYVSIPSSLVGDSVGVYSAGLPGGWVLRVVKKIYTRILEKRSPPLLDDLTGGSEPYAVEWICEWICEWCTTMYHSSQKVYHCTTLTCTTGAKVYHWSVPRVRCTTSKVYQNGNVPRLRCTRSIVAGFYDQLG